MHETTVAPSSKLLSRPEAAAFLSEQGIPIAKTTLGKLASVGGGPLFRKFGPRVLYAPADLTAWANSKLSEPMRNTSDVARKEGSHA